MSESLNVLRTGRYEARTKGRLVTDLSEAGRQWEIWNLSNKAQRSLRENAGLNVNEPICSTVMHTLSNGMTVCVEPFVSWRRQHHAAGIPDMPHGHTGVTGQACGEGYSKEDGRDCIAPVRTTMCTELIKRPNAGSDHAHCSEEVTIRIIGREIGSDGMQPVRRVHSRDETSVMEADPKGPDFCNASGTGRGFSSRQPRQGEA